MMEDQAPYILYVQDIKDSQSITPTKFISEDLESELLDYHNRTFGTGSELHDTFIQQLNEKIKSNFNQCVKMHLHKKGFHTLAESFPNKFERFPQVMCVQGPNLWQYFFADDGTPQGAFIVAISPVYFTDESPAKFFQDSDGNISATSFNVAKFDYQDIDYSLVRLPEKPKIQD